MQNLRKLIILMVFISTNALADGFIASVGGDYSKGDYGSSESTMCFVYHLLPAINRRANLWPHTALD